MPTLPAIWAEPNEPVEDDEPLTPADVISAPLTPPAINDNLSAELHPIPVFESVLFGVKFGTVDVGVSNLIANLLLAFPWIAALSIP